jgi:regulatory protein
MKSWLRKQLRAKLLEIREQALKFLARREYSRYELQRRLAAKGWSVEQISEVLDELAEAQLQSDTRFLEMYIRHRRAAGYGPRRIIVELTERGVTAAADALVNSNNAEWLEIMQRVWQKKFNQIPTDLKAKAQQIRFLIYRGFTPEQVQFFLQEYARVV